MTRYIQDVEVMINATHYDVVVLRDIISVDEDAYSSLDIRSIKGCYRSFPSGADLGEVWIASTIIIHQLISNPILAGTIGSAVYDLLKFMVEKTPRLLENCIHNPLSIMFHNILKVKTKGCANITIDLCIKSDEISTVSNGLEQLKELIESLQLEGDVKITYSNSEWYVSNDQ